MRRWQKTTDAGGETRGRGGDAASTGVSERKACQLAGVSRSVFRDEAKSRPADAVLTEWLRALAKVEFPPVLWTVTRVGLYLSYNPNIKPLSNSLKKTRTKGSY